MKRNFLLFPLICLFLLFLLVGCGKADNSNAININNEATDTENTNTKDTSKKNNETEDNIVDGDLIEESITYQPEYNWIDKTVLSINVTKGNFTCITYRLVDGKWVPQKKDYDCINHGNRDIYMGRYSWSAENNDWQMTYGYMDEITLDDNGRISIRIQYSFSSEINDWIPSKKDEYFYDQTGGCTKKHYDWNSTENEWE